jgi:hypothetical protein
MILLSIGMGGLYSMSVVQTRQTVRLTGLLDPDAVLAINRVDNAWARKLGVYANIEDAVTAVNSPYPYEYYEAVIDEADGEPAVTHYSDPTNDQPEPWVPEHDNKYYKDDGIYKVSHGETGSWIEFAFTGVPPGEYEVLTTYPAWTNNATGVRHQIYDGNTFLGKVTVDQTQTLSDLSHDGQDWARISVVEILSGTMRVRLIDGTDCEPWMLADGIMIRTVRSFCLHAVSKTDAGGATAEVVLH